MYFIENLQNLLDITYQLKHVLNTYPPIKYPKSRYSYANKSLFTLVNTYANTEAKSIIKESYGNGCEAILLLQARCARITPQDTLQIEEKFNNTHIEPNETATQYIRRFRDAKLLAKSVGMKIEPSKLIDKFLLSMRFNKRYILTAQHLSNQRRHEEMSNDYTHIQLTMMEVESHLYANDKNSTNQYQAYQVNVNKSSISYHRPRFNQNRVNFSN